MGRQSSAVAFLNRHEQRLGAGDGEVHGTLGFLVLWLGLGGYWSHKVCWSRWAGLDVVVDGRFLVPGGGDGCLVLVFGVEGR